MEINIQATPVFHKNYDALLNDGYRFIVNVGGTRSSKTYSLSQLLIIYCLQNPNKVVSIVRKSFPALRATVMRDVISVLQDLDLYKQDNHNKTENIYTFPNGSKIEFFSVDDEQKIRGRKRDILWANEANELNFEEFNQLNFRTTEKLFFDFNPSMQYHWLYDIILKPETIKIHSTYLDNPFLEERIVKEIEGLKEVDEAYYKIYCLGEQAVGKTTIYSHPQEYDGDVDFDFWVYGLDFGFTHPTALIQIGIKDENLYVREVLYQNGLTASDLINTLLQMGIDKNIPMICDYARPEIITDLRRNGFNCINANKNVREGIDFIKSKKLFIHKDSINTWKEIRNYKYKSNGDIITEEPIKLYDDAMDAMRYGGLYLKTKTKKGSSISFTTFNI